MTLFLHGDITCKKPMMEWGMGLGGWELDGVQLSILFILFNFIVQAALGGAGNCPDISIGMETQ